MLELAILGLLKQQELHGYELKKRLLDTLGPGGVVSFGSLYPALGRLERAGAVAAVAPEPPAARAPMTGSISGELAAFRTRGIARRGGRTKKVYAITARGEELFAELLAADTESSRDDRLFNLRLAFARYLPAEARLGLLELRRAHLTERLGRLAARLRSGKGPLDAYGRSLIDHDRQATEHDISWIDQLIASERQPAISEPEPVGAAALVVEAPAAVCALPDPPDAAPTPASTATPAAIPATPASTSATPPTSAATPVATPAATLMAPTTASIEPTQLCRLDRPSLSGLRSAGRPGATWPPDADHSPNADHSPSLRQGPRPSRDPRPSQGPCANEHPSSDRLPNPPSPRAGRLQEESNV